MAIEIVDLPSYKMVIFHSYVKVYQRVNILNQHLQMIFPQLGKVFCSDRWMNWSTHSPPAELSEHHSTWLPPGYVNSLLLNMVHRNRMK